MGLKPQTTTIDPNPKSVQPAQKGLADLLLGASKNPAGFGGLTSDLQRQATGGISQFLGQQSPEQSVFNNLQNPLMALVSQGMQGIGGFEQSQALVGAAQPIFAQNLQAALGSASNAAPGRFSTAHAAQGIGLGQKALQDFNLFQQQALQQGLGLDLQARQMAQSGILGAGGLLGQLGASAGQAPFNRMLQAGEFGIASMNPTLQLLLGGLNFARPSPLETIVGPSKFQQVAGGVGALGSLGLGAFGLFGNRGSV